MSKQRLTLADIRELWRVGRQEDISLPELIAMFPFVIAVAAQAKAAANGWEDATLTNSNIDEERLAEAQRRYPDPSWKELYEDDADD